MIQKSLLFILLTENCFSHDLTRKGVSQNCVDEENDCAFMSFQSCTSNQSYTGNRSITVSGLICQNWNLNWPHFSQYKHLADHNFCRNYGRGGYGAWCYTTEQTVQWEYCFQPCKTFPSNGCIDDVDHCAHHGSSMCKSMSSYGGTHSVTVSGKICAVWSKQRSRSRYKFIGDHNYCRNPDGVSQPWCFTTDSNVIWEWCFEKCYTSPYPNDGTPAFYQFEFHHEPTFENDELLWTAGIQQIFDYFQYLSQHTCVKWVELWPGETPPMEYQGRYKQVRFTDFTTGCYAASTVNALADCWRTFHHEAGHYLFEAGHYVSRADINNYYTKEKKVTGEHIWKSRPWSDPWDWDTSLNCRKCFHRENTRNPLHRQSITSDYVRPYLAFRHLKQPELYPPVSFYELRIMNNLWKCIEKCHDGVVCLNQGYRNPANCSTCNCPYGLTGPTCDTPYAGYPMPCGGKFLVTDKYQIIQTPGFPNTRTNDSLCVWLIEAPEGKKVQFELVSEPSLVSCDYERIDVRYDDLATTGTQLCNTFFQPIPSHGLISTKNVTLVIYEVPLKIEWSTTTGYYWRDNTVQRGFMAKVRIAADDLLPAKDYTTVTTGEFLCNGLRHHPGLRSLYQPGVCLSLHENNLPGGRCDDISNVESEIIRGNDSYICKYHLPQEKNYKSFEDSCFTLHNKGWSHYVNGKCFVFDFYDNVYHSYYPNYKRVNYHIAKARGCRDLLNGHLAVLERDDIDQLKSALKKSDSKWIYRWNYLTALRKSKTGWFWDTPSAVNTTVNSSIWKKGSPDGWAYYQHCSVDIGVLKVAEAGVMDECSETVRYQPLCQYDNPDPKKLCANTSCFNDGYGDPETNCTKCICKDGFTGNQCEEMDEFESIFAKQAEDCFTLGSRYGFPYYHEGVCYVSFNDRSYGFKNHSDASSQCAALPMGHLASLSDMEFFHHLYWERRNSLKRIGELHVGAEQKDDGEFYWIGEKERIDESLFSKYSEDISSCPGRAVAYTKRIGDFALHKTCNTAYKAGWLCQYPLLVSTNDTSCQNCLFYIKLIHELELDGHFGASISATDFCAIIAFLTLPEKTDSPYIVSYIIDDILCESEVLPIVESFQSVVRPTIWKTDKPAKAAIYICLVIICIVVFLYTVLVFF